MIRSNLASIVAFVAAYLAPVVPALITCALLVAVDTITGIIAAKSKGESIQSRMLYRIAPKLLVYNLLIITGYAVQQNMGIKWIPFTDISTGVIALIEFKSILENVSKLIGKDVFEYIKDLLNKRNLTK
jgi:phage-related holin